MKKTKSNKIITYIPSRYIIAVLLSILEISLVILSVFLLTMYLPYFYIAVIITTVFVILNIISSNENPDYKIPWLLFVIILPIVGFMLYFMFYKRKLPRHILKRFNALDHSFKYDDTKNFEDLKEENMLIYSEALMIKNISNAHIYKDTALHYYKCGEEMFDDMIEELKKAQKFIFLEYFIIENGFFWDSILNILKEKVQNGVEVKILYDDIGCMTTLPGNYTRTLKKMGIDAVLFSKLKGQADGEFNNRSHRKILVIDGLVGFTGGINIADEYINRYERFGYWKDTGIKMCGNAVNELTKLFLVDYNINIKKINKLSFNKYYVNSTCESQGFVIPFGDGPKPMYDKYISKSIILNMLNHSKKYVYITTPYLIIDNEMTRTLENTALRGVDVRIIVPHIPDKKTVFALTRDNYNQLIKSGVKVYEYRPGFIHAKSYIADGEVAMIGTINLDYRSLAHHFENGVWIYKNDVIKEMEDDFINTMNESIYMNECQYKPRFIKKTLIKLMKIFSPLF
ncbi:MAG: cardiolipin synthase [Anaeroplasmataceae bacterium]